MALHPHFPGLVLVYSTLYNPRRTEDSSYSRWSVILAELYGGHREIFIPCPQYGLYVSPTERFRPSDLDDSFMTTADRHARGVYVDLVVLLPRVARSNSLTQSFPVFLHQLSITNLPFRLGRMFTVDVSILVELKRPPTRHPKDILSYLKDVERLLAAASSQCRQQAQCLFSSLKYSHQDQVCMIAAAGEWWCFRMLSRTAISRTPAFSLQQYIRSLDDWSIDEEYEIDEEEFVQPAEVPKVAILHANQRREEEMRKLKEKDRQTKERQERVERRNIRREMEDAPDAEYPYTEGDIDHYWHALHGEGFFQPLPQGQITALMVERDWTKPMRLGSEVSKCYLQFIEVSWMKWPKLSGNVAMQLNRVVGLVTCIMQCISVTLYLESIIR